ncbi:MAG: 2Fe-2S iron-sulfur cluster-binding protein [Saprospiraceae bacterium]
MNIFFPAKIKEIKRLTDNAVNIEFEIPADIKSRFEFKAGQYIVIRIPSLDADQHRSYSLSASPGEGKIQIGVKRLEGGLVSEYLWSKAESGDPVELMAPQGSFFISDPQSVHSIVAFVSGSGITPVISILKDHLSRSKENVATLFYGNKTSSEAMYVAELQGLMEAHIGRLEVIKVFSQQLTGLKDLEGRIDKDKLDRWKTYMFDLNQVDNFLLCGPGTMVVELENAFKAYGVQQEKILTELFTAPVDSTIPKETITPIEDQYRLEYKVNGKWYEINVNSNSEVLVDIGLNQGLDLPYSCKSGVCSTCQAKLVSGTVKMDNNYVLSDKELAQGFILTCQSHATSTHLKIDYDMK